MSLSKHSEKPQNPCKKFLRANCEDGTFKYWDKEAEKEVAFDLKGFIVLDELATITGWSDENESALYSNEVHNTQKEVLKVRAFKGGELVRGIYKDVQGDIAKAGGKYTKSIYIKPVGFNEIYNLQAKGAMLRSWIEKECNPVNQVISIEKWEEKKKGKVEYKTPVFVGSEIQDNEMKEALDLDKVLQKYLKEYKEFNQDSDNTQGSDSTQEEQAKRVFATPETLKETSVSKVSTSKVSTSKVEDLPF